MNQARGKNIYYLTVKHYNKKNSKVTRLKSRHSVGCIFSHQTDTKLNNKQVAIGRFSLPAILSQHDLGLFFTY